MRSQKYEDVFKDAYDNDGPPDAWPEFYDPLGERIVPAKWKDRVGMTVVCLVLLVLLYLMLRGMYLAARELIGLL